MRALAAMALGAVAFAACATEEVEENAAPSSVVSVGGSSAKGGSGGSGGAQGVAVGGGGGAAGDLSCATSTASAEAREVDMYIMLDQSGSMTEPAGSTSKWLAVKTALLQFFSNKKYDNTGVGVQFFPLGTAEAACPPAQYAVPALSIKPLSQSRDALLDALNLHAPVIGGETPTRPALQGAVAYARGWASQHPDRATVVVLATDGKPTVCGTDLDKITIKAKEGYQANPKVLTFVIGVGEGFEDVLDAIAEQGGTGKAAKVDVNSDVSQQFQEALDSIRREAVDCDFSIPKTSGGEIDFGRVNVRYATGSGQVSFYAVPSADKCGKLDNAWHFDDAKSPTKIVLCPAACSRARQAASVKIDVVFGCKTEEAQIN